MFETLLSKTFFILACSLGFCCLGVKAVINYFRKLKNSGSPYVTAVYNEKGQENIVIYPSAFSRMVLTAAILGIVSFVLLMICRNIPVLNMILLATFTFLSGTTLGVSLVMRDENLGMQAAQLTALAVLLTGVLGMRSGIDFSFLGGFLFVGLILLIIGSIVRIFININGTARKMYASFGILIFCGYLLYDFSRLVRFNGSEFANTWGTALRIAIDLYLDIINLFIYILDFLGNN